jgi:hypothetical protein
MRINRTFAARLPLAVGFGGGIALLLARAGVFDCSSYSTYKDLPTDCSAQNGYVLYSKADDKNPVRDLTLSNFSQWFGAADYTLDGGLPVPGPYAASIPTPTSEVIPNVSDAGLCDQFPKAMVFHASHNNDWGGLFGNWNFAKGEHNDASNWTDKNGNDQKDYWEGIAFWVRAPGATTKGFTLSVDDENTQVASIDPDSGVVTIPSNCRPYSTDGGVSGQSTGSAGLLDPNSGTPLSGSGTTRAAYPDECGNSYTTIVEVTSDWRFYVIPFSQLKQDLRPNRLPNSAFDTPYNEKLGTRLVTSALRGVGLRMTREAEMELWIAGMAFYHKNQ